jgi:hypothetical protein
MTGEEDRERLGHPLMRFYLMSIVGSLLIVALILTERDLGGYAILILLFGALGVAAKSRVVPVVLMVLVALMVLARSQGYDLIGGFFRVLMPSGRYRAFRGNEEPNALFDTLLALAMVVYLQGQFRLCVLLGSAMPAEGRTRSERKTPLPREPGSNNASEGIAGLGVLSLVVVLAGFTWVIVYHSEPLTEVARETWRTLLMIWLLASALIVTTTLARIAFWRVAPPEVHQLYLQETLWRETRAEQSRINRWVMAARLKAQKRRES